MKSTITKLLFILLSWLFILSNNIFAGIPIGTANSDHILVSGLRISGYLHTDGVFYSHVLVEGLTSSAKRVGDTSPRPSHYINTPGEYTFVCTDKVTSAFVDTLHITIRLPEYAPSATNILYVNKNVQGGDLSGSSWENAIPDLADALVWVNQQKARWTAASPLQVWVAEGTYLPTPLLKSREVFYGSDPLGERYGAYAASHVEVYGGFAGTETNLADRDTKEHVTRLSGDQLGNDIPYSQINEYWDTQNDNYGVWIVANNVQNFALDGITFTGLNARNEGGTVRISNSAVAIKNCVFERNFGGCVAIRQSSSVQLSNTIFRYNAADGGQIHSTGGSIITVWNSLFQDNLSAMRGVLEIWTGLIRMYNSTVVNNNSPSVYNNVGMWIYNAEGEIYNSVIINSANPAAKSIDASSTTSSKLMTIKSSIIQGLVGSLKPESDDVDLPYNIPPYVAPVILESDLFVDPANGDYTPLTTGVLMDRGNLGFLPSDVAHISTLKDLAGNSRLMGAGLDIGAFENTTNSLPITLAFLSDTGLDTSDRITPITQPAFSGTTLPDAQVNIWLNDQVHVTVLADGQGNWNYTFTNPLPDGAYVVAATGAMAGYVSVHKPSISIVVDATPPVISGVTNGGNYTSPVTVTFNEGSATINGSPLASNTEVRATGNYTVVVQDAAGHSTTVTFTMQAPVITPSTSNILYVNKAVVGGNRSGDSWQNAIPELADALLYAGQNKTLFTAVNRLQIWVAKGTYKPLYSHADATFGLPDGRKNGFLTVNYVDLHGGFAGTETQLAHRNWHVNPTVLDGDLLGNDDPTLAVTDLKNHATRADNAYSIVLYKNIGGTRTTNQVATNAQLDGFHITNANNSDQAGAIYFDKSYVTLDNIIFSNNSSNGAAIMDLRYMPPVTNLYGVQITNALFRKNTGTALIINNTYSPVATITNATMVENYEYVPSWKETTHIRNSIMMDVSVRDNGYLNQYGVDANVWNSLYYPQVAVANGSDDATGIALTDVFVHPEVGDYRLKSNSPAIGVGNVNHLFTLGFTITNARALSGRARFRNNGSVVDLGAYEFEQPCTINSPVITATQNFCGQDFTLENIVHTVQSPNKVIWYATATGGEPLPISTPLQHGQTYYAAQYSESAWCESTTRRAVTVNVEAKPIAPVVDAVWEYAQGATAVMPTVQALPTHTIQWYDASQVASAAPTLSTTFVGKTRYYVSQKTILGCESERVEVVVSITPTISIAPDANGIVYVNKNVSGGTQLGDSWTNAVAELGDALEMAQYDKTIKEVWVAAGTYVPTYMGTGSFINRTRDNTFPISNLRVYGGFNGTETQRHQRKPATQVTLLSGERGQAFMEDNVRVLVTAIAATDSTILDGFTLEKAFEGTSPLVLRESTGAIWINRCIIRENNVLTAGGIYTANTANVVVSNTQITHNTSSQYSIAMNVGGDVAFNGVLAYGNSSTSWIEQERAGFGNTPSLGSMQIVNSIIWGNDAVNHYNPLLGELILTISHSITQPNSLSNARIASTDVLEQDPLFTDAANGNFNLQPTSPAKNAGSSAHYEIARLGAYDLAGQPRLRDNAPDLGPYEVQEGDNPLPVTLVHFTALAENNTVVLHWQTTAEVNTKQFVVERSTDGKQFATVGVVAANQTGAHAYTYTDERSLQQSVSYYRLRMVDLDDSYAYSHLVSVASRVSVVPQTLTVYPNPVESGRPVTITVAQATQATLYDLLGNRVAVVPLKVGTTMYPMPQLVPGVYIVVTSNGTTARILVR